MEDAVTPHFWLEHYQYIAHRACRIAMDGVLEVQKNNNPNAYFLWGLYTVLDRSGGTRFTLVDCEKIYATDTLSNFDLERLSILRLQLSVKRGHQLFASVGLCVTASLISGRG